MPSNWNNIATTAALVLVSLAPAYSWSLFSLTSSVVCLQQWIPAFVTTKEDIAWLLNAKTG